MISTYKIGETYPSGTVVRYGNQIIIAKKDIISAPEKPDENWTPSEPKPGSKMPLSGLLQNMAFTQKKTVTFPTHLTTKLNSGIDGMLNIMNAGAFDNFYATSNRITYYDRDGEIVIWTDRDGFLVDKIELNPSYEWDPLVIYDNSLPVSDGDLWGFDQVFIDMKVTPFTELPVGYNLKGKMMCICYADLVMPKDMPFCHLTTQNNGLYIEFNANTVSIYVNDEKGDPVTHIYYDTAEQYWDGATYYKLPDTDMVISSSNLFSHVDDYTWGFDYLYIVE